MSKLSQNTASMSQQRGNHRSGGPHQLSSPKLCRSRGNGRLSNLAHQPHRSLAPNCRPALKWPATGSSKQAAANTAARSHIRLTLLLSPHIFLGDCDVKVEKMSHTIWLLLYDPKCMTVTYHSVQFRVILQCSKRLYVTCPPHTPCHLARNYISKPYPNIKLQVLISVHDPRFRRKVVACIPIIVVIWKHDVYIAYCASPIVTKPSTWHCVQKQTSKELAI